jgi:hypothetical protein
MEPEQLLWNQYQQLTDEIKSADTLNYQALGIVIAASVAIVNAAFTRSSPEERCILLLTVFAVTIPGGFLLQVARRRIWRITTYLEIFIEPALRPIKWQTRLTSSLAAKPTATNVIKTEFWLVTGLDLIASGLNIATVPFLTDVWRQSSDLCIVIVLLGHSVHRAMRSRPRFERGGKVQCEYRDCWNAIKASEAPRESTAAGLTS